MPIIEQNIYQNRTVGGPTFFLQPDFIGIGHCDCNNKFSNDKSCINESRKKFKVRIRRMWKYEVVEM